MRAGASPGPRRRRYGQARARARERGATSIELALLTPVLLFVILFVVQYAMIYHAEQVARAAARAGAREARGADTAGWQAAAKSKAESYAQQIGANILIGAEAFPSGGADERFVEVQGEAIAVIPGWNRVVRERAGGPVECFRPDVGDGVTCEPQP
jgi:hypothetical protein